MKLGAEPKKVAILGVLLVVAAVVLLTNGSGGGGEETAYTPPPAAAPAPGPSATAPPAAASPQRPARGRATEGFRPSLKPKRGEERPDPMKVDPRLRTDVLAKLQTVDVGGGRRSIFDFSAAPPPKAEPAKEAKNKPKAPSPIVPVTPEPPKQAENVEPPKPQAPPIPLRFFGYVSPAGRPVKRAFFVQGDDIHIVTEGDVVNKRYKIIRIGVNSVVVEDTQFGSQQTLPLEEQQG